MLDWLYQLPVPSMTIVVLAVTALVTWLIHVAVASLAANQQRTLTFKAITPALLPPLGVIFGLLVAFLSAQVWNDSQRATLEVSREARSLRAVDLIAGTLPASTSGRIHALLVGYVRRMVQEEWPAMARQDATLAIAPPAMNEALHLTLAAIPDTDGQRVAQREVVAAMQQILDARRQRIIISRSSINWVKWLGLIAVAIVNLVAIAMVHADNRAAAATAMGLFGAAVALSVVLIAAHARPFTGTGIGRARAAPGDCAYLRLMTACVMPLNGSEEDHGYCSGESDHVSPAVGVWRSGGGRSGGRPVARAAAQSDDALRGYG
jgi:hypothetical protein